MDAFQRVSDSIHRRSSASSARPSVPAVAAISAPTPAAAAAPVPPPVTSASSGGACFLCGESIAAADTATAVPSTAAYVTYASCAHRAHFVPCAAQQLLLGFARCACRIRDVDAEPVSSTAIDHGFDKERSNERLAQIVTQAAPAAAAPVSRGSVLKTLMGYFAAAAPAATVPQAAISSTNLRAAVCAGKGAAELKQRGFMLDMIARAQLNLEFFLANRWSLVDLHALGLTEFDQLAQLGLKLRLFVEYRSLLPIDVLVSDFRGSTFDRMLSTLVTPREQADLLAQLRALRLTMDELRMLRFSVRALMQFAPTLDDIKALHIDVDSAFRDFGVNRAIYMQLHRNGPSTSASGGLPWHREKLDYWMRFTDQRKQ